MQRHLQSEFEKNNHLENHPIGFHFLVKLINSQFISAPLGAQKFLNYMDIMHRNPTK